MGRDIIQELDNDVASKIIACLDDPSDVARVASVSQSWRHFLISNGIWKNLCLKLFPQLSAISHVVNFGNKHVKDAYVEENADVGCSRFIEQEHLQSEHRLYASLVRRLTSSVVGECLAYAISASSTDNFPREGVHNTLASWDGIRDMASYWSSSGQSDPEVSETLTYNLISDLCVINEINIQPFQASFQENFPIYSAKAVRFRMGHRLLPDDSEEDLRVQKDGPSSERKFVWTYTSQEFPMKQENRLQHFKLPEPVLCIGGSLQIELLGRVQKQASDGLFYICVECVQVGGRPLCPMFEAGAINTSGNFTLVYNPEAQFSAPRSIHVEPDEIMQMPRWPDEPFDGGDQDAPIGIFDHIMDVLNGAQLMEVFDSDDEYNFEIRYGQQDSDEDLD